MTQPNQPSKVEHLVDSRVTKSLSLCLYSDSNSFSPKLSSMGQELSSWPEDANRSGLNTAWHGSSLAWGTGHPYIYIPATHIHTSHTGLYTTHMERPLVRQRETIKGYFLPWPHNISFPLGVHVFLIEVI